MTSSPAASQQLGAPVLRSRTRAVHGRLNGIVRPRLTRNVRQSSTSSPRRSATSPTRARARSRCCARPRSSPARTRALRARCSRAMASRRRPPRCTSTTSARAAGKLLNLRRRRQDIALVSDAGTPALSDPGALLVAAAHARRHPRQPGARAQARRLPLFRPRGFAADRFLFAGFLPAAKAARAQGARRRSSCPGR